MTSFMNPATFDDRIADDDTCSLSSSFTEPSSISSGNTSSSSDKDSDSEQPADTAHDTSDDSADDDVDSSDDIDSRGDDSDSAGSLRAFVLNDDEYHSSDEATEDEDGEEEADWRGVVVARIDAYGYCPLPGYEDRRLRPTITFKVREIHTEEIPNVLPASGATRYCPTRRRMHLRR